MRAYIIRRLLMVPLILLVASLLAFVLIRLVPGDATVVRLGAAGSANPEARARFRHELGLDKPVPVQYLTWLAKAAHGDFGFSTASARSINRELRDATLTTLQLAVVAILFTVLIGVPVGAISAVKQGSWIDLLLRFCSILGLSVPNFWIATLVVLMPAYWWHWTPAKQWVSLSARPLEHVLLLLLPGLVISIGGAAYVARIVRSSMLDVLHSDHVRTARAKGLAERIVIYRHVFRGSVLVLLTVLGLQFGLILGGSILIEDIFGIPGLGHMVASAVLNHDYPAVQATTMVLVSGFLLVTLLVDISYAWADPRIRY
jgi:peptide/nickel transport system permease protein